jgi:flagellar biosynthesis/type III secretory pathway ATPase
LVLDRALAERGHYPPLDIVKSLSRVMNEIVSPPHRKAAQQLRAWLSHYDRKRDLVELGAVSAGADPLLDRALLKLPQIDALLRQTREDHTPLATTIQRLVAIT